MLRLWIDYVFGFEFHLIALTAYLALVSPQTDMVKNT